MSSTLDEHIEYLTLPGRSDLYREAIAQSVTRGDVVADLGCGVGVLGLFALEAGASEVIGIDSSAAIHLARESMERAGYGDRFLSIAESTFRTELDNPVDAIICDHVGYFGIDYGIVAMLRDAAARFLKPGGVIVPRALDLSVAAVSSDQCRDRVQAWVGQDIPAAFHWIDEASRNVRYPSTIEPEDLISPAAPLGHVALGVDGPDLYSFDAELRIDKAGRFDGVAGWFDAALAGDVRMTNSPLDPATITRSQAFLPARKPFDVNAGDTVKVTVKFRADVSLISWNLQPPGGAPVQRMSTWKSKILSPADLAAQSNAPLKLSQMGTARAYILSLVDGSRGVDDILAIALRERPDLLPSEQTIIDFVRAVLGSECES